MDDGDSPGSGEQPQVPGPANASEVGHPQIDVEHHMHGQEVRMESKAKFLGHPIHPILIVFPFGLLATSAGFDIVGLLKHNPFWFHMSFWMIAAGILGALVSSIFGLVDWLDIPLQTRAKRIGLWHGAGNLLVTLLFVVSWLLRRPMPENPRRTAFACSFLAVVLVTGWLGGELVDRLGVGVDPGANLNAPSSLSGRPAGAHSVRPAA